MPWTIKRKLSALSVIFILVAYYVITDPDILLLSDLPFGAGLLLTLNIFVISITAILLVEFAPDFFIDRAYGNESVLRKTASNDAVGSALVLVAKSLRILGYCIIITGAIVAYGGMWSE